MEAKEKKSETTPEIMYAEDENKVAREMATYKFIFVPDDNNEGETVLNI